MSPFWEATTVARIPLKGLRGPIRESVRPFRILRWRLIARFEGVPVSPFWEATTVARISFRSPYCFF